MLGFCVLDLMHYQDRSSSFRVHPFRTPSPCFSDMRSPISLRSFSMAFSFSSNPIAAGSSKANDHVQEENHTDVIEVRTWFGDPKDSFWAAAPRISSAKHLASCHDGLCSVAQEPVAGKELCPTRCQDTRTSESCPCQAQARRVDCRGPEPFQDQLAGLHPSEQLGCLSW